MLSRWAQSFRLITVPSSHLVTHMNGLTMCVFPLSFIFQGWDRQHLQIYTFWSRGFSNGDYTATVFYILIVNNNPIETPLSQPMYLDSLVLFFKTEMVLLYKLCTYVCPLLTLLLLSSFLFSFESLLSIININYCSVPFLSMSSTQVLAVAYYALSCILYWWGLHSWLMLWLNIQRWMVYMSFPWLGLDVIESNSQVSVMTGLFCQSNVFELSQSAHVE